MLILAADTSLPVLSIALVRDSRVIGSIALEGTGSRNEKLLPAIDWILGESKVDRREIEHFAVTRGPGSFTGVRIGLATIQGLALVLGRKVTAISTHEAALWSGGIPPEGFVTITDDAGRGELFLSRFDGSRLVDGPKLSSTSEAAVLDGTRLHLPDLQQTRNVALGAALRAADLVARGEASQHEDVTPLYVRLAEAEVKLIEKSAQGS